MVDALYGSGDEARLSCGCQDPEMHLRGGQVKKEDRWEVSCGHWGILLENRLTGVSGASGHAVRAGCQIALVHLFLLQGGADPPSFHYKPGKGLSARFL